MGLRERKVINHDTSIKGPNGVGREEKRGGREEREESPYILGHVYYRGNYSRG